MKVTRIWHVAWGGTMKRYTQKFLGTIFLLLAFLGFATVERSAPPLLLSLSISPTSATLVTNATQQFLGTVANATIPSATWSVTGDGSITPSGLFTAGSAAGTATVTLTSAQDATQRASAAVIVTSPANPPPVSVSISPTQATLPVRGTLQFTASVANATNPGVTWSATGAGTINSNGLFTAGSVSGAAIVTATSVQDRTKSASASVSVIVPPPPPPIPPATSHLLYIAGHGGVRVYDIDNGHNLVQTISLPQISASGTPLGMSACVGTGALYISYGRTGGSQGNGSLLAYDLIRNQVLWSQSYNHGVDSMAITPDCKTIYMPEGEGSSTGGWHIVSAADGHETGTIQFGVSAHNTLMSLNGAHVYLGPRNYNFLGQASTSSNTISKQMGPLIATNITSGNGVRPFTVDGRERFAFTTESGFLGFQVSDVSTGSVLWTLQPAGFTMNTRPSTPSHGISLSPDERELYFLDWPNFVHVYDVSALPAQPTKTFDITLAHPTSCIGWLSHSRNGRYVYVGCSGDVIDTASHTVLTNLPLYNDLADNRYHVEVDWANGAPVFAMSSRMGQGYVTGP
jgi:hypothetical protein